MKRVFLTCLMFIFPILINESSLSAKELLTNKGITTLIKKADSLSKSKKYTKAINLYNEALSIASKKELSSNASFIYKKIGLLYYRQQEWKQSKVNFKRSISKDSLSIDAADSYLNLTLIYRKQKKQDSLLWSLDKSVSLYKIKPSSEKKYATFLKAGILYKNAGEFNNAIQYLLLAYEGFRSLRNVKKQASVCATIATTQGLLGNYEIAKQYAKTSLGLRLQVKDSFGISNSYNSIGNILNRQEKYDSAVYYYEKSISLKKKLNYKKGVGRILNNMAAAYQKNKQLKKAIYAYKEALIIKKREKDTLSIAYTYNELALLSLQENKIIEGRKYLDFASNYISNINNKDVILRNYEVQSLYFKVIKDYQKALFYKEQYSKLYKEIFNKKQSQKIQELQERFQSTLKQQQISALSLKNLQKEKIIDNQQNSINKRNWYLSFTLLLLLLSIGFYFYIKQRQKTKEKELKLEQLKAVFKGQELIKENISKDLHDIITTNYDGIRLKILALLNAKDQVILGKEIIDGITNINQQIRLISHRLSPLGSKIKNTSLSEIIISQLSEFQYYRKIFMDVQLPLPKVLDELSIEVQTNFYGILLEVLSNIEKHSGATEVQIKHHITDANFLLFEITDNGVGFVKEKHQGIGLLNIDQRAKLLNGSCTVSSSEKGTTVTIEFPITKK